jgi:hypothetical protein
MIVPTLTMFGLVRECTRDVSKVLLATGAVVTRVIMASVRDSIDRGSTRVAHKVIQPRRTPPAAPGRAPTGALVSAP